MRRVPSLPGSNRRLDASNEYTSPVIGKFAQEIEGTLYAFRVFALQFLQLWVGGEMPLPQLISNVRERTRGETHQPFPLRPVFRMQHPRSRCCLLDRPPKFFCVRRGTRNDSKDGVKACLQLQVPRSETDIVLHGEPGSISRTQDASTEVAVGHVGDRIRAHRRTARHLPIYKSRCGFIGWRGDHFPVPITAGIDHYNPHDVHGASLADDRVDERVVGRCRLFVTTGSPTSPGKAAC